MNNTLYFLRHGKPKIDKDLPISKWVLSEAGELQAQEIAKREEFKDIDLIITSTETKAFQTAKQLADLLGKEITQAAELCELNRDNGGFMNAEKYEETVKESLSHPDTSVSNWEPAGHALKRFSDKIEEIDQQFEHQKILIVGHGYTMNMYFAKLLGELDKVYERLERRTFYDWGIVEDGQVIKDLGK